MYTEIEQLIKNHDINGEDKEILITIRKAVDASPELRSKKQLVEDFIANVNEMEDVMAEWHGFVAQQREADLSAIIADEKLKPEETKKFLENSFRDGEVKTVGTDIDRLMPPVSRFGGGNREKKKQGIIDKLKAFFEKYFGIGGPARFTPSVYDGGDENRDADVKDMVAEEWAKY